MKNVERIYELLEEMGDVYLTELLPLDIRVDVLEILEESIIFDLEMILEKIKYYAKKVSDEWFQLYNSNIG